MIYIITEINGFRSRIIIRTENIKQLRNIFGVGYFRENPEIPYLTIKVEIFDNNLLFFLEFFTDISLKSIDW